MDNPDFTSINSPNINSVLKPPKHRVPLKDLVTIVPEEDNTAARKRRVSFANVNKIKEFSAGAESMVVCHTPAYEEPFSLSSDSSYPSGIDGWTPAKGQTSIYCKPPIYPGKENISIQPSGMSTVMDFTNVVGDSVQSTRYSLNGMDVTETANSHGTCIDQRPRFSLGMDLTNVVGHPLQNTRYSVSGMDLTNVANPHQTVADHSTRFSIGMDFTNVIRHSTQNTRYSINGMDLTEAGNPHQAFFNERSARFSVGMDMTNIVGDSVNTMRYSCNEMDLTEAGNPHIYQNQYFEGGLSANGSMDDSKTLELTEPVSGAQFSAISPKFKNSGVGLTENILYSVNNTKYSASSMDMTRAASLNLSTARRMSSRYSLGCMDLTDVVNNSCGDLEFTEVIRDPKIRGGSTRYSMCEMDLTESIVDKAATRSSTDNMEHTSVAGDKLEYSADAEASLNFPKTASNLDPPVCDKENILPNSNPKMSDAPILMSQEDPGNVFSKTNSIGTAYEALPKFTPECPIMNENEHSSFQNIMPLNNSHNINHENCKELVNESSYNVENSEKTETVLGEFKEKTLCSAISESSTTNKDLKGINEHEDFHITENYNNHNSFSPLPSENSTAEVLEKENIKWKEARCMNNKVLGAADPSDACSINYNKIYGGKNKSKIFPLSVFNCNNAVQKPIDIVNQSPTLEFDISEKESKLNEIRLSVDNFEHNCSIEENNSTTQQNSCAVDCVQHESRSPEPICKQLIEEDPMDISVSDNIEIEELKSNFIKEQCSVGIEKSVMALECSEVAPHLNESVMKISIENCSMIKENKEHDEQEKKNDFSVDILFSETNHYEINHQANLFPHFIQEERHQLVNEDIAAKTQSTDNKSPNFQKSNISLDSSISLPSSNVLYNPNITMTRGKIKSFVASSDTSIETSNTENIVKNEETSSMKSVQDILKSPKRLNEDRLSQPKNNFTGEVSFLQAGVSHEKRGKRSFEAALEPENDTEESPIKQICLSREEPSAEYEILNNVTAPSFLMDTLNAPNETVPGLDQHETTTVVNDEVKLEPTSSVESNIMNTNSKSTSEKMFETNQEISLRMDNSLINNMSENASHNEVIDLCESSFDASSTEDRELMNNSLYKTKNINDADVLTNQNESFNYSMKKDVNSSLNKINFDQADSNERPQCDLTKGSRSNNILNMDDTNSSTILEREVETTCLIKEVDELPRNFMVTRLKSGSRSKMEKVKSLGNGTFAGEFIPNVVEIQFSIDRYDNITEVNYQNICLGLKKMEAIGEYLLTQARNHMLPVKGSDLILQLKSTNESFLVRLARNLNMICKYYNGSIKGYVLTLEVASCRNHFWTFIEVNIRHPEYLNQTDITISKQKIGELKLSQIRKIFCSIEKTQDQLLDFTKAITELQYSN